MQQRISIVNEKPSGAARLVMAGSPAQAIRHVANARFDVKAANAVAVAELMAGGAELEKAGENADQLELAEAE